jgi:NADH dehydrogenase FAD-containing subunit
VFILIKILLIGAGDAHKSVLQQFKKQKTNDIEITLISSSNIAEINKLCEDASVAFKEDTVISFDPLQKMLLSFSGEIYRFDVISFDVDMKYSLFQQALVPVDSDGLMLVEDTLQNTEYPFLFGAGDCVTTPQHGRDSFSSTEQGIVLWKNIKRFIHGQKLKPLNRTFKFDWLGRLIRK